MSEYRDWPHDLSALQDIGQNEILPQWQNDGRHPTQNWPSHEWLVENGYSHLRWILEQKHEMTVKVFFTMIVGVDTDDSRWAVDTPRTLKRANEYMDWGSKYREWNQKTRDTNYYLLNRVFREYTSFETHSGIVEAACELETATETYDLFVEIIHHIKQDAKSDDSAYQYMRAIQRFYEWLTRRHIAEYNPVEGVEEEFQWDRNTDGSEPLSPDQVGRLWEVATELVEYLLIIGYVIWGVRRQELPSIHQSQFVDAGEHLHIEFEETDRKTGAGTVKTLFGEQYIQEQLDRLSGVGRWNGHLIPKQDDPGSPMSPSTAARKFKTLCRDADVMIDDQPATPNNGRATWHDFQTRAGATLEEIAREYSDEQDYDDVSSMLGYQGAETKEEMRQMLFVDNLKGVLPEEAYNDEFVFLKDVQNLHELSDYD